MFVIRPFVPQDALQVAQVFFEAVHGLGPDAYSPAQVDAWAPGLPDIQKIVNRALDGRVFLVAVDRGDLVVGYGDMEQNGHIDHLYCHPAAKRQGVATAIYQRLEQAAQGLDLKRLYVEASELALPFFTHQGFTLIARQEVEQRGVLMHNYRMAKVL